MLTPKNMAVFKAISEVLLLLLLLAWRNKSYLKVILVPLIVTFFEKNCCPSPACALCDAPVDDAKDYFLYCPIANVAALREKLFASAVQLLRNRWHYASDQKKK